MAAKIQKKMKKTAFGCEKYRVIAYFRARAALFHVIPCGCKTLFARRALVYAYFVSSLYSLNNSATHWLSVKADFTGKP